MSVGGGRHFIPREFDAPALEPRKTQRIGKRKRTRQALKFSTQSSHRQEPNEISSRPVGKGADLSVLRIESELRPRADREEASAQIGVCDF